MKLSNCSDGVVLMHNGLEVMRCMFVKVVDGKIILEYCACIKVLPLCRYVC